MRVAIVDPYLETLGGGERYMLTIAQLLGEEGAVVDIESGDKLLLDRAGDRFGLSLKGCRTVQSVNRGDGYDVCVWLSDGSIPTLFARKNILHIQRPFYGVNGGSLLNRMKLFRVNRVIVNSQFTKHWTDKEYRLDSFVLYPPVDTTSFKEGRKENIILSVGRFSQLEQSKRQDVLLETFMRMYDKVGIRGWKLIIAGGSEVGRTSYVDRLIKHAKGYPVEVIENPSFKDLVRYYGRAKIFWSASGWGVDEDKEPNRVEHFGIVVVEAMAAGVVPLACNAGGFKETIVDGTNGYLWDTKLQLSRKTMSLIDNPKLLRGMAKTAIEASKNYSYEHFKKEFLSLI